MSEPQIGPGARWFEQFEIGDVHVTQGRTITETDSMLFAMFSGDMNPIHVDDEFAKANSPFGGRIPQGLAVVSIASGLQERLGLFAGTGRGLLEQSVRYRRAVQIGDTVSVRLTVREKTDRADREWGTLVFGYEIVKADGTVAVEGTQTVLVANRPQVRPR
ncbi:MAG TPA: MaoC/PaaZ C-terminal domain-containing protein [Acidimicrobiales bacterium]|jgi:acyl dehydratase|nr:MaoC/PaaZ C-terminal domain-containing protein [Acidimicrobiales bacterium]